MSTTSVKRAAAMARLPFSWWCSCCCSAAPLGGGYWAWREGYIDLNALLGQEQVASLPANDSGAETASAPTLEGPGNTTATPNPLATSDTPMSMEPGGTTSNTAAPAAGTSTETAQTPPQPVETPNTATSPSAGSGDTTTSSAAEPELDTAKSEDRLTATQPSATAPATQEPGAQTQTTDQATAAQAATQPGAQSLLLEASSEGTTGAVPYSGTVEWSRGTDELGQPTIVATANIPARNLGVKLLIRKNGDPSLPASHLMEIDFSVTDSFIGGSIAGLPGVLMKNEELVQGMPLVGASARVVGNSFLFALSSAEQDVNANNALLRSRKWIDLAMVYATGKRAIITLEKDEEAQKIFDDVMDTWAKEGAAQ